MIRVLTVFLFSIDFSTENTLPMHFHLRIIYLNQKKIMIKFIERLTKKLEALTARLQTDVDELEAENEMLKGDVVRRLPFVKEKIKNWFRF
tara:strand:+ start:1987 stop:2259 length:273 start_codon:yes stop_codon:yes gene_type:complete